MKSGRQLSSSAQPSTPSLPAGFPWSPHSPQGKRCALKPGDHSPRGSSPGQEGPWRSARRARAGPDPDAGSSPPVPTAHSLTQSRRPGAGMRTYQLLDALVHQELRGRGVHRLHREAQAPAGPGPSRGRCSHAEVVVGLARDIQVPQCEVQPVHSRRASRHPWRFQSLSSRWTLIERGCVLSRKPGRRVATTSTHPRRTGLRGEGQMSTRSNQVIGSTRCHRSWGPSRRGSPGPHRVKSCWSSHTQLDGSVPGCDCCHRASSQAELLRGQSVCSV